MAKQKNRLTTTRQVLAGERFAYPVPTIHPQKTVGDETRILLTLEPTLNHTSRPNRNLARTKLAYPTPLASRFDRVRPASRTLDLRCSQVSGAYPVPTLRARRCGLHGSRHQTRGRETSRPQTPDHAPPRQARPRIVPRTQRLQA